MYTHYLQDAHADNYLETCPRNLIVVCGAEDGGCSQKNYPVDVMYKVVNDGEVKKQYGAMSKPDGDGDDKKFINRYGF
jgi:hypothetical protein